mmetsp:Transcript_3283/g.8516  ORF Transcript_3283/g.8516 Transcript_3283/m.8516 type:complete len:154 (+) Transcript_3283:186-647(+)
MQLQQQAQQPAPRNDVQLVDALKGKLTHAKVPSSLQLVVRGRTNSSDALVFCCETREKSKASRRWSTRKTQLSLNCKGYAKSHMYLSHSHSLTFPKAEAAANSQKANKPAPAASRNANKTNRPAPQGPTKVIGGKLRKAVRTTKPLYTALRDL